MVSDWNDRIHPLRERMKYNFPGVGAAVLEAILGTAAGDSDSSELVPAVAGRTRAERALARAL
jgi:hypothetical protein